MSTHEAFPVNISALLEVDGESYEEYINRQSIAWFGETLSEPDLAEVLRSHAFLRALLVQLGNSILPLSELIEKLEHWDPTFAHIEQDQRSILLQSFLALVAHPRCP